MSSRGKYRLCPEFVHYGEERRREIVSVFEKAKLPRSLSQSSHSVSVGDNSGPSSAVHLSIIAEDSGISAIPYLQCGTKLLSQQNGITAAPGNGELMNFLQWYIKSGQTTNISALALSGLPCSKPKRQRSKVPPTAPDNYVIRPGLVSISSGNAPIVQVSEHHQPLNASTTISEPHTLM